MSTITLAIRKVGKSMKLRNNKAINNPGPK